MYLETESMYCFSLAHMSLLLTCRCIINLSCWDPECKTRIMGEKEDEHQSTCVTK